MTHNAEGETTDQEIVTFKIDPSNEGERLDAYLASRIQEWSRARLQRLIDNEDVLVNGNAVKPSYKLQSHDEIEVELTVPGTLRFAAEEMPIEIVYEDDVLLVVNKPAGLVVHPAAGIHSGTLANGLAYHFQRLPSSSGSTRPGIVHRLDRDTSGLLVVAKTEAALEHLADQFRNRSVFKSYVALVHGRVEPEAGRIDQPIARDLSNRTRMAVVRGGRSSLSLYRVRRHYQRFTLLDVELKTGRTHQIRVHFSWLKHPVVGDEVYGSGRDKTVIDPAIRSHIRKLRRHFLHAEQLGFVHPKSSTPMRFTALLPPELLSLLSELDVEEQNGVRES